MESVKNLPQDTLNNLNELIQAFTCSLDIRETLDNTLQQLLSHLQTEAASVFLLNKDADKLECQACVGPVDLHGVCVDVGKGIIGKAVSDSQIQLVRDTQVSDKFSSELDKQTGFSTRSILCTPLIVQGKTLGAIELINKIPTSANPEGLFNSTDQQLLEILASSAALAIHNATMATKLVQSEKVQQELSIARTIQESFLPQFDEQHPIMGINLAAKNVSGDFFDYMLLPNGHYIFNIGDVSGKGMNAALLMAKASSLYHCLAKTHDSPASIMEIINNELCEKSTRGMFITMIGGQYDPKTGMVIMANAGHLPAIKHSTIENTEDEYTFYESRNLPLGILADQVFEEVSFSLANSNLYLYTDGLSEGLARAQNKPDELENLQFLIQRFKEVPRQKRLDHFAQAASTAINHGGKTDSSSSNAINNLDNNSENSSDANNFDDLTVLLIEGKKDGPE